MRTREGRAPQAAARNNPIVCASRKKCSRTLMTHFGFDAPSIELTTDSRPKQAHKRGQNHQGDFTVVKKSTAGKLHATGGARRPRVLLDPRWPRGCHDRSQRLDHRLPRPRKRTAARPRTAQTEQKQRRSSSAGRIRRRSAGRQAPVPPIDRRCGRSGGRLSTT